MAGSMYAALVEVLGGQIAAGEITAGSVISLASLEDRFDVSRTVAREAMRALESKGMIEARRRVGLIVTDKANWHVLDPQVIGWRLAGPGRNDQLRTLVELRIAVEPTAARLAALHGSAEQKRRCLELAEEMLRLGERGKGRSKAFLAADVEFHVTILQASGNEMLAALEPVITAVLVGRSKLKMTPQAPAPEALESHVGTARAMLEGEPEVAEARCRRLVSVVRSEID